MEIAFVNDDSELPGLTGITDASLSEQVNKKYINRNRRMALRYYSFPVNRHAGIGLKILLLISYIFKCNGVGPHGRMCFFTLNQLYFIRGHQFSTYKINYIERCFFKFSSMFRIISLQAVQIIKNKQFPG